MCEEQDRKKQRGNSWRTEKAEKDVWIQAILQSELFHNLLPTLRRVESQTREKGGGLAAAISVFLEELSSHQPGETSAYDHVRALCQQKCFAITGLQLGGKTNKWYDDHPFVQRAIKIAHQMSDDPPARSMRELQEVFLRARFLMSAKTLVDKPLQAVSSGSLSASRTGRHDL